MKKISILALVLAFLVSGVSVFAEKVVESSGSVNFTSTDINFSPRLAAAKKKVDCANKKNKKKKECKKPNKVKNVEVENVDAKSDSSMEGQVVEGTSGENVFKEPTGSGKYRFRLQTAWENPKACDYGRTLIGSKGKIWEEGWYKGYDIGKAEGVKLVTYYDETPQGAKAGTALYDEGYRMGYDRGFAGGSIGNAQYQCKGSRVNLADYDEDGWYKIKLDKVPGLKALYLPFGYAGLATGSSLLGNGGAYVSFEDASKGPLNGSAALLNFTRADFMETDLDAAEQKMSMKELAQGTYDVMIADAGKKYKNVCTFDQPLIEDHTYGGNTFTNLNWVTICNTGGDGGPSWMLNVYSFKKLANNKILVVQLFSPLNIKLKGKNELDTAKFPSANFVDQLYAKMEF